MYLCVSLYVVKTGLEQIVLALGCCLLPVENNAGEQSYCTTRSTSRQKQKGGGRQSFL